MLPEKLKETLLTGKDGNGNHLTKYRGGGG